MTNQLSPNLDPRALAGLLSGKHLIDGALVPAASGKTFDVKSPATREIVAQAAFGEKADVDLAVATTTRSDAAAQHMSC